MRPSRTSLFFCFTSSSWPLAGESVKATAAPCPFRRETPFPGRRWEGKGELSGAVPCPGHPEGKRGRRIPREHGFNGYDYFD